MSKLGFGAYRISHKSSEHREALRFALDSGVGLIDTSANYTGGESETLIGEVLKAGNYNVKIVSKVGYLQGENLELAKRYKEDLVNISPNLKHSIHPDFIENQINQSLKRLDLESLDIYLLHNPEYYLKTEGSTKEEYYRRIALAFNKLEELVKKGKIKSYGISSNVFVNPRGDHQNTDLDTVYHIAKNISESHHFKYIQFPMNLIEMGALEREYDGSNLIERAQSYNLKTIINRPLNAFSEHGLLRLATYEVDEKYSDSLYANELFNELTQSLVIKWLEVREDESEKLYDLPIMKQVSSIWHKQNSKDAVDQVFMEYFFPLIANIWGRDMTPEESQCFYDLYEHALEFTKANMNTRANQFHSQAIEMGLLSDGDKKLSHKVIEKYFMFGADYILVGMRKKAYAEELKSFF
jgi:aryl-alcohol dehydrogenase-like predicted oxidoreductase